MSDFQISIVPAQTSKHITAEDVERFSVRQHGRGAGKVLDRIDDLEEIWDKVIQKLTDLAAKSQVASAASAYELSAIEFNIGIEAGLSVGLVTKADASISVSFTRKAAAA